MSKIDTRTSATTTISILLSDKNRLDRFKLHRREPYSEVLNKLLNDIEKLEESGMKFPNRSAPQSYQSHLKAMIESTTKGSTV